MPPRSLLGSRQMLMFRELLVANCSVNSGMTVNIMLLVALPHGEPVLVRVSAQEPADFSDADGV